MNIIKTYMTEKGKKSEVEITGKKRYKNRAPMLSRLK